MPADPAPQTVCASYDPTRFKRVFAVEDRHFWFRARNHILAALVAQLTAKLASGYRVLEVGCGTGNTLRALEQAGTRGTIIGMDLFGEGLRYARQRFSCALVQGDMQKPPFKTEFHLIGLFDVLEHLTDDRQVLHDLHTMLIPNGALLLTVPAHPSLWSYRDEVAHHRRRYTRTELAAKLEEAGYQVEYLTPYMTSIFPLVWGGRRVAGLLNRQSAQTSSHRQELQELDDMEMQIRPGLNGLLTFLLTQEARLMRRRYRLPFGTSLLAIARK